jgi:CheY-like chemotaxis protein
MPAPHPIALLGFSPFERDALASYFRLAINREPRYESVPVLTDAELLVVDADDRPAVDLVTAIERVEDCVFIGATAPPGAGHRLGRPIDPLQVMRLLDTMVTGHPPLPGDDAARRRTVIQAPRRAEPMSPGIELDLAPEAPAPAVAASVSASQGASGGARTLVPGATPASPPAPSPAPIPAASDAADLPPLDLQLASEPIPVRAAPARPAGPAPESLLLQPSAPTVEPPPARWRPASTRQPSPARPAAGRIPAKAAPSMLVRALVVDDSELAQRFLLTRLERFGLLVDCTGRSDAALSMLARSSHDFVFVDMELGDASPLDGLALCQQIRREQTSRVPPSVIVVVTAHTGELDRVRATLAGCDAFLGKPLDERELERLLARHGLVRKPDAPPS